MKKTLLILFFIFIFVYIANAQKNSTSNKDEINKLFIKIEESMKDEMYYHSYSYVDEALAVVEDKKQLKKLFKYISKLKEECPQKPSSICECLERKIAKGQIVHDEVLFWHNCKDLIK